MSVWLASKQHCYTPVVEVGQCAAVYMLIVIDVCKILCLLVHVCVAQHLGEVYVQLVFSLAYKMFVCLSASVSCFRNAITAAAYIAVGTTAVNVHHILSSQASMGACTVIKSPPPII